MQEQKNYWSENDHKLETLIEAIETMRDDEYIAGLQGEDLGEVLNQLIGLKKVATDVVKETLGDEKETDMYALYTRYSKCLAREIHLVNNAIDTANESRRAI